MYKTLGAKWLCEHPDPHQCLASSDRNEASNPQRFIHITVSKKNTRNVVGIQKYCFVQESNILSGGLSHIFEQPLFAKVKQNKF